MPKLTSTVLVLLLLGRLAAPAQGFADGETEFFETKVRPVLAEHCYRCHGPKKQEFGLRLDSLQGLLKGGDSGPAIVPGKPDQSLLISALKHEDYEMPPSGKLPKHVIDNMARWVRTGAPWPDQVNTPTTKPPTIDPSDHWAFRTVLKPPVPSVDSKSHSGSDRSPGEADKAWPRNPIDSFILGKLQAAGVQPAVPADRRTLIRRLSFDLVGLPPTVELIEGETTIETIVDQLLASPHYGERWARHWLDLARYADTKGYVYTDRMEKRFVHSHLYRDWVIRALNEDMPYDKFLKLQLAADQMECDRADLAALGFLTLGRWQLGVMPDIIDDRIDTTMRTMQGLTVSCARCHDHKYDPIPTRDYYSLYGVFANCFEELTPLSDIPTGSGRFLRGLRERQSQLNRQKAMAREAVAKEARAQVADYLILQAQVEDLPGDEVYLDLHPGDLVPALARRWNRYLAARKEDPLWRPWHAFAALPQQAFAEEAAAVWNELSEAPKQVVHPLVIKALEGPPQSLRDVADAYGRLFARIEEASNDDRRLLRAVLDGPESPCLPPDVPMGELAWFLPELDRVALGKLEADLERFLVESPDAVPHVVVLRDRSEPRPQRVFRRGNPSRLGETVPRQFLWCVAGDNQQPFLSGSGRKELAEAIASPTNPLTARVIVNRVWQHYFGQGLVRTPSDFGTQGQPPTHPELLDWLAAWFVEEGWSLKKLHRLIVHSAAYRQSAVGSPAVMARDPENLLLARQHRKRLELECLRDSLLFVSGELDLAVGGRPRSMFDDAFSPRRTIYGFLDRQFVPAELKTLDMASLDLHTAQRFETTVAPQGLLLLNGQFTAARARAVVERLRGTNSPLDSDSERIRRIYRRLFARDPAERELQFGLRFLRNAARSGVTPQSFSGVWARNGSWQRVGDELHQTSDDTDVGLFFGDSSWTDYTLEVEAQLIKGTDGPQVAFRVHGPRAMYWMYYGSYGGKRHGACRETGHQLEDVAGPGPAGALEPGRWYRLKVDIRGDQAKCYFDGELVYQFQDSTHPGGCIGLGSWGAQVRYRNLKVTDQSDISKGQVLFFGLPEPPGGPLTPWERYVHTLLMTNEFSFVD